MYDEWVLDAFEDLFLVLDVVDVLALDDLGLLHGLHRVLLPTCSLQPAHAHVPERTCIFHSDYLDSLTFTEGLSKDDLVEVSLDLVGDAAGGVGE